MGKIDAARARLRRAVASVPAAPPRYAMNVRPPQPELLDEVVEAMSELEQALRQTNERKET
jgi:hypothetical protein